MNQLLELLRWEATDIDRSFGKASIEGRGTPQEVSDRREIAVSAFLGKYFPFPYRIAKGIIWDSFGNQSASIDSIILSPLHPYTVSQDGKHSIIMADGVDTAIEVKPDLCSQHEIERALHQIKTVKQLVRKKTGILSMGIFTPDTSKDYAENAKRINAVVFANRTYEDESLLIKYIAQYYLSNNIPRQLQFDFLVVNNRFVIANVRKNFPPSLKLDEGLHILRYKEDSLAGLLFLLSIMPQAQIQIQENIMTDYLQVEHQGATTYPKLNEVLLSIETT